MANPPTRWRRFLQNPAPSFAGFLLQTLLTGCAVILGIWIHLPWPALAGLGLLAVEIASVARARQVSRRGLAVVWGGTLLMLGGLLSAKDGARILDSYGVALAWLNAAAFLLTSRRTGEIPAKNGWKILAMTWAFFGGCLWLALAYSENLPGAFYLGLLVNLALLIGCLSWFRLPASGMMTVNTLILLLLGLPVVDLCLRPHYQMIAHPDPGKKYYLYENAKKDPAGFASWQAYWARQWESLEAKLFTGDPTGVLLFRLRPNSQALLVQSRICINSKGFRGREIPEEKGDAYRIVALGESTTFGLT